MKTIFLAAMLAAGLHFAAQAQDAAAPEQSAQRPAATQFFGSSAPARSAGITGLMGYTPGGIGATGELGSAPTEAAAGQAQSAKPEPESTAAGGALMQLPGADVKKGGAW